MKISKGRRLLFFLLYEKCKMVPPPEISQTHTQQWILLRTGGWGCRKLCRFCDGCKAPSEQAKKWNFLPLHMAKATAQGHSNVTAAKRAVTLKEGGRKRRRNPQLLRSWRELPSGLQGKEWAIHGVELACRGESLLPEHSTQQESLSLQGNMTLLATVFFKYKLCCLGFLISPSDHLYFNSFRCLKKSNYILGV